MKFVKNLFVVLLALFISFLTWNISLAQVAPPKKEAPVVKNQVAPTDTPKAVEKSNLCDCLKGAIDAIQKSYVSLEEDEWPAAIKTTKDAINTISTLAKTCACPETVAYQKLTEAYLKYAEGGNHLDGAEEPNCPYAIKLYSDAIVLLDTYIPKITNATVKENAEDVKEYVKEEKEFVDEECSGAQAEEKPKGPGGESKEKKQ